MGQDLSLSAYLTGSIDFLLSNILLHKVPQSFGVFFKNVCTEKSIITLTKNLILSTKGLLKTRLFGPLHPRELGLLLPQEQS